MPDFTIDFEAICEMCGETLKTTTSQNRDFNEIQVVPCITCMNNSYDEGFEEGQKE